MRPLVPSLALVAGLLAAPAVLDAQRVPERQTPNRQGAARAGRFSGTILDASTQRPIAGARISSPSLSAVFATDSLGNFDIPGVPPGIVRFYIFAPPFPRATLTLAFASGEVMVQTLELDSTTVAAAADTAPQQLPQLTVEATPLPPVWLRDFERRRTTGRGQYVTREQIERRNYNRLSDVLQVMRGVTLDCGGGGSACTIRMVRAAMQCPPAYWIDGLRNDAWGPLVPVRDIEGLEVYTGATDTPGEFAGSDSACGTIVIWTSSGLTRRRANPGTPAADSTPPTGRSRP